MLDLYRRSCPRCNATLTTEWVRCRSCHKLLPRRLSRLRRVGENGALSVLLVVAVVAIVAPDLTRSLMGKPPATASPAPEPWLGAGPEPATRAWAVAMEPGLQRVCRSTFTRYANQKLVIASLSQYLPQIVRENGQPLTPETLRFSPDEEKDALLVFGDEDRFLSECLRWSYEALTACETYKANLASRDATSCMVNTVQAALVTAPFTTCASAAKSARVKRACSLGAAQAALLARAKG